MGFSESFQTRCGYWLEACFTPERNKDVIHRNKRFLEEALELVQASDMDRHTAHALVDYVFDRPKGEINQEVGGVMMTIAAHCLATGTNMEIEQERELSRVWSNIDKIRAKDAAKPTFIAPVPAQDDDKLRIAVEALEYVKEETRDFAESWEVAEVCDERIATLKSTAAQETKT